jgi:HEAT repeat protein
MGWILRLEDQRVLRDAAPAVAPPPPVPVRGQPTPPVATPPPPPDLIRLLSDDEPRVRRRAALAIGRVALAEGVPPLVRLLTDTDPEVRQMAAFALGLIGDKAARAPLVAALADASPLVQGSAAEALGLIGDATAADAIGRFTAQIVQSGALAQTPADDDDSRRDTPAAACRLGLYALVRLKAYPQLAAAVLDPNGQPRVRWWPVAFALQRIDDKRALPALLTLAKDAHPFTRAFAVKGLAALKDRSAVPVLMPLLSSGERAVLIETVRALGSIGDPAAADPAAADPPRCRCRSARPPRGGRRDRRRARARRLRRAARRDRRSESAGPRRGPPIAGRVRPGELRHFAVRPRSRLALERSRRAPPPSWER